MIESAIIVKTEQREYVFASITISENGIQGIDNQTHTIVTEIPFMQIQSMKPHQVESVGVLCMN